MRLTERELLEQQPYWNTATNDIVAVKYGDSPLYIWNEERMNKWRETSGTLANIQAVDAFIYTNYGTYSVYETLLGKIYITENNSVLAGDINVQHSGQKYNIILNNMYGTKSLDILRIGSTVTGFSNLHGQGSPSRLTKELNAETVGKILNQKLEEYGVGVQKFMDMARDVYKEDPENHIMEKLFCI